MKIEKSFAPLTNTIYCKQNWGLAYGKQIKYNSLKDYFIWLKFTWTSLTNNVFYKSKHNLIWKWNFRSHQDMLLDNYFSSTKLIKHFIVVIYSEKFHSRDKANTFICLVRKEISGDETYKLWLYWYVDLPSVTKPIKLERKDEADVLNKKQNKKKINWS